MSSGFNFKDILANGQQCSEDEDGDLMESEGGNPLSATDELDLDSIWQRRGYGREFIRNNVERLVEEVLMKEAMQLIKQN